MGRRAPTSLVRTAGRRLGAAVAAGVDDIGLGLGLAVLLGLAVGTTDAVADGVVCVGVGLGLMLSGLGALCVAPARTGSGLESAESATAAPHSTAAPAARATTVARLPGRRSPCITLRSGEDGRPTRDRPFE